MAIGTMALEISGVPEDPLRAELKAAFNRVSAENGSNTPDWVLADFVTAVVKAFDTATRVRESWYGVKLAPGQVRPSDEDAVALVFQALGEASMCWENPDGAGVFQDVRAADIGRRLVQALGFEVPAGWERKVAPQDQAFVVVAQDSTLGVKAGVFRNRVAAETAARAWARHRGAEPVVREIAVGALELA